MGFVSTYGMSITITIFSSLIPFGYELLKFVLESAIKHDLV